MPASCGTATVTSKMSQNAGDSVFFINKFAMLSMVFKLKQNLEAQPYPEINS